MPTKLELAKMSAAVYQRANLDKVLSPEEQEALIAEQEGDDELIAHLREKLQEIMVEYDKTHHLLALGEASWQVGHESPVFDIGVARGFYAVTFQRNNADGSPAEIVIAFRGTSAGRNWIDNLRLFVGVDYWPNVLSQLPDSIALQQLQAEEDLTVFAEAYTEAVLQEMSGYNLGVPITFTGHSLGGYLALMELVRNRRNHPHRNTVASTFDNPGYIANPVPQVIQGIMKSYLREFLSSPNAVNTVGVHYGKKYFIPPESFLLRAIRQDTVDGFVEGQLGQIGNMPSVLCRTSTTFNVLNLNTGDITWLINAAFLGDNNPLYLSRIIYEFNRLKPIMAGGAALAMISSAAGAVFGSGAELSVGGVLTGAVNIGVRAIGELIRTDTLTNYVNFFKGTPESHDLESIIQQMDDYLEGNPEAYRVFLWPSATINNNQELGNLSVKYVLQGGMLAGHIDVNSGAFVNLYSQLQKKIQALQVSFQAFKSHFDRVKEICSNNSASSCPTEALSKCKKRSLKIFHEYAIEDKERQDTIAKYTAVSDKVMQVLQKNGYDIAGPVAGAAASPAATYGGPG